jgi:putative flippase GtrA
MTAAAVGDGAPLGPCQAMASTTQELAAIHLPRSVRVRTVVTQRRNLMQFARFLGVGAVGYVVNLAAFAAAAHGAGIDFRAAAVASFVVALLTTFVLNRHFTFAAGHGPLAGQLWRYLLVNLAGFATNLLVLIALVSLAAVAKLPAEAAAAAVAAPVNFLGGRLWAFAQQHRPEHG